MKELTGERTAANAWASLFSPADVVGIKINCVGAPRISSSLASIKATIAGLKSAGVKENNIIIWDRVDRELPRTGLEINKARPASGSWAPRMSRRPSCPGSRATTGTSMSPSRTARSKNSGSSSGAASPRTESHRDIFNSVTWLWTLCRQGNEKAKKYEPEIRRLYMDYEDREGIKRIAEEVADQFDDVTIEDEEKSFFANIVTKDITKLVNIAVLKHNEDSGVTWATKNIALGVTTNKVRFHIDYCAKAIPEILATPCLKDKMILHIGEAAKISTVSVAGAQFATDNRIFFSRDPVAMDRIGLDILEEKRRAQGWNPSGRSPPMSRPAPGKASAPTTSREDRYARSLRLKKRGKRSLQPYEQPEADRHISPVRGDRDARGSERGAVSLGLGPQLDDRTQIHI